MSAPTRSADDDWADVTARPIMSACYACDPDWDLAPRRRGHYQLWAVTSGEMDFRIGPGPFQRIGPRTLIVLPPQVVQRATFRRGPLRTYVTHFMAFDHGVPNLRIWAARVVTGIPAGTWAQLVDDLDDLGAVLSDPSTAPDASSRLLATAAMTRVLGRMVGLASHARTTPDAAPVERRAPDPVGTAIAYVRAHPEVPLSTRVLAAQAHTSPEALRSAFRRAVGQSPGEFIRQHRLTLARTLLRESDLPVAAVARRAGYPDPFYFSRVFRLAEGVPPSQWRESLTDSLTDPGRRRPPHPGRSPAGTGPDEPASSTEPTHPDPPRQSAGGQP